MEGSTDLRAEAEKRAQERQLQQKQSSKKRTKSRRETLLLDAADPSKNTTPDDAVLVEMDYKFNGSRAKYSMGDFVPPRWVPDLEIDNCCGCGITFDWMNRRHHCRHCGKIFCQECSPFRDLLPLSFCLSDPQRVCNSCHEILGPIQYSLTHTVANHQKVNSIDTVNQCSRRYLNLPYSSTLGSEIRKAAYSTYNLFNLNYIKDKAIPLRLISKAYGLVFLTMIKAGFGIGGRFGTGLVISRLSDGSWSAPSAIATVGVSWGFLIGCDLTDAVLILNTSDAVRAFTTGGQITLGAEIDVAVGPVGRSGSADVNISESGYASIYSYSHCRGLYASLSLEGSLIYSRTDVNQKFYGHYVTPYEILSGQVPPPKAGQPLYEALEQAYWNLYDPDYAHKNHIPPSHANNSFNSRHSNNSSYHDISTDNATSTSPLKSDNEYHEMDESALFDLALEESTYHSKQSPHKRPPSFGRSDAWVSSNDQHSGSFAAV